MEKAKAVVNLVFIFGAIHGIAFGILLIMMLFLDWGYFIPVVVFAVITIPNGLYFFWKNNQITGGTLIENDVRWRGINILKAGAISMVADTIGILIFLVLENGFGLDLLTAFIPLVGILVASGCYFMWKLNRIAGVQL